MDPVTPILMGMSITGSGTHFVLPRAGVSAPKIAHADATHVSLLPLFEGFFLHFIACLHDFLHSAGGYFFCSYFACCSG